ncbi:YceH family protein [Mucilaginibacter sp. KACC 22063]|uniref:YceH family protein n=1 Tax=Mucilaginibacter sp. KACC 22063 TaxID=3025666 RepID=UPI002365696D|nr:YceH family protein [Mucilaginibacter sp. KACC 22063]WDF56540.1 YceH family protein [Mucilaginibacter sp. KACC 22063]
MDSLPKLSNEEIRVLGSLMEKSRTTPDYYPMTLNGLVAACNQKSSRRPVVDYDDDTVIKALDSLKKKGLISTATGGSSRVVKYKHNFAIVFPVIPSEVAIICLLLLRGPQTPGEINTNSGRLWEFESLDEVQEILEKLSSGDMPYLTLLPKRAGQKEQRYMHLLGETLEIPEDDIIETSAPAGRSNSELEARVTKLEEELAALKEALKDLLQ